MARLEDEGRLEFHTHSRYMTSIDTMVRVGSHVLVDAALSVKNLIALDFSRTGMC